MLYDVVARKVAAVVALRSARLEAVFGKRLDDLEAADIRGLLESTVTESYDLDFKEQLYGGSDSHKRKLASHVGALANTAGGVIIFGIAEDEQSGAGNDPGVPVNEVEVGRIHRSLGENLSPVPKYDVIRLQDPPGSGHGFIVIAVPRSPAAPHAVLVGEALRYPMRNGSTTRHLSEPEVADAYRRRFQRFKDQNEVAAAVERDAISHLHREDRCWLVFSIVPDLPGGMVVDHQAWKQFRDDLGQRSSDLLFRGLSWRSYTVGRRRLIASGAFQRGEPVRNQYLELHDTGVGVLAHELNLEFPHSFGQEPARDPDDGRPGPWIDDEELAFCILASMSFLGQQVRDRAGASGNALLRCWVVPPGRPIGLGYRRNFSGKLGDREVADFGDAAEHYFPLDSLASQGPGLVAASQLVMSDIIQAFGCTEPLQFDAEGRLRIKYWNQADARALREWAERSGVEVTDETVRQ